MIDEELENINGLSKMLMTYMNVEDFLHSTSVVAAVSFSALHFYNRYAPLQYRNVME